MMRTTISLHESTFKKVKELSRKMNTTLGDIITELLNIGLNKKRAQLKKPKKKFILKTFSLGKPKVPLEDKEALYALLDKGNQ